MSRMPKHYCALVVLCHANNRAQWTKLANKKLEDAAIKVQWDLYLRILLSFNIVYVVSWYYNEKTAERMYKCGGQQNTKYPRLGKSWEGAVVVTR